MIEVQQPKHLTIARAPLRISFFGGGTDFPEYFGKHGTGAVLGTAIDKYSYITANRFPSELFDYSIRVSYRQVELVKGLDEIQHKVVRECLRLLGIAGDIEIHNVADLPAFSGLGASSTFTVSLLKALHAFQGSSISGLDLAYEAIHIERNVLKEAVGCQDQVFAAMGGLNYIEFRGEDNIDVRPIVLRRSRLSELASYMLIAFTGIKRRAAVLTDQHIKQVDQNVAALKQMRELVDRGLDILLGGGALEQFGALLHKSWMMKRDLCNDISNSVIDSMYQCGLEHGALGGKLLGAGGGGFLLLFVPPDRRTEVCEALGQYCFVDVNLGAPGAEIIL